MITELTAEQKAKFPHYVDKWIKIGTDTARLNYDETVDIIHDFQREILQTEEKPVIIVDNPIEAWVCCCLFELDKETTPNNVVAKMKEFFNGNPHKWDMPKPRMPYQTGSFFAPTFSYYNFFFEEFGYDAFKISPELQRKYEVWERTVKLGMIYPIEHCCIVSQKPKVIKLNENNVLHCDGGPALEYEGFGKFKIYSLNGVRVPEWLAVTPARELDIDQYLKEKNADVKAEFIRKFGVENMLHLGKKVDSYENYDEEWWTKSQYELWDMSALFTSKDYAPYLKMLNQTTKVWHLEGVSPKNRTIPDALKERFDGRDFIIKGIA
jgi:hypothetical protein